jgi:hypothetical protein
MTCNGVTVHACRLVIPRVIGWICVEQKAEVLQRLAEILDTTPAVRVALLY